MNGLYNLVNEICSHFLIISDSLTFVDLFYNFIVVLFCIYTLYFVLDMLFFTVRAVVKGM